MSFDCDVLIVGGGPSGATAGAWLARAGRKVVLLERDTFPRFHIGESLLASVNDVLDEIGAADVVRAAGTAADDEDIAIEGHVSALVLRSFEACAIGALTCETGVRVQSRRNQAR